MPNTQTQPELTTPQTPTVYRWLTYILLIPLMIASTVFFGTLSLICGLWDKSGRQQHFTKRLSGPGAVAHEIH